MSRSTGIKIQLRTTQNLILHSSVVMGLMNIIRMMTLVWSLVSCCYAQIMNDNILVVGATGTTGLRSVQGLLDVGYEPHQLHIVTLYRVLYPCHRWRY
jgi:hypothetical protein